MTRNKRTPLLVGLLLLAAGLPAQVQSNSPDASLLVNGRAGAGFGGTMPILVAEGAIVTYDVAGMPNVPFGAVVGAALEPGLPTGPGGLANVDPGSFIILLDGFLDPFWSLDASGMFSISGPSTGLTPGTELALQAYVPAPVGLVLTAPARFVAVPGDPIPPSFMVTFPGAPFAAGNRHAVVGDVNGDSDLDICNSSGIWTGDGALGFTFVAIDPGGVEAALADVVGDSNLDLIVLDEVFLGLKIFTGDGTGNFLASTPIQLPALCSDAGDVAVVDLDGDSDLDIVLSTGNTASPGLLQFANFGGGLFFLQGAALFDDSRTVTAADFDGDLTVDLACDGTTSGTDETRILWGSSSPPGLSNSVVLTAQPEAGSRWLRAQDMDGDGYQDLIWVGSQAQGVLFNDGSGGFSTYSPAGVGPTPGFWLPRMDAADMDDDGDLDLVFVDRSVPGRAFVVVAVNDGSRGFDEVWYLPLLSDNVASPTHVLPADLNGDGKQDLVVAGAPVTLVINGN